MHCLCIVVVNDLAECVKKYEFIRSILICQLCNDECFRVKIMYY